MLIWLLRHGDAEAGDGDDAARDLTAKGERQARAAGAALARLEIGIEACLTSPKVRSERTARLACEPLGIAPEVDERLRGGDFDPFELAAGRGAVLLVGHEPDMSRAIQIATGARAEIKKGGLAALDRSTLVTLLRPGQLRLLAGG